MNDIRDCLKSTLEEIVSKITSFEKQNALLIMNMQKPIEGKYYQQEGAVDRKLEKLNYAQNNVTKENSDIYKPSASAAKSTYSKKYKKLQENFAKENQIRGIRYEVGKNMMASK
ncbi:unnamed protein product [Acanthoscelides obtectus]|uniref:Uncharacterized protein n=1 Tax=Acanthoscelides obtectus TaxID=200917 RepID=A0A9P0KGZ6_ACAOB|nr:unnamed protein product [Acanthoscelides obtectus]CAK1640063.1 hypothetical protein AOBTE_LOCUS11534 [Acanthoscelides obtectus]